MLHFGVETANSCGCFASVQAGQSRSWSYVTNSLAQRVQKRVQGGLPQELISTVYGPEALGLLSQPLGHYQVLGNQEYVYLPTPNGPVPVAMLLYGSVPYAIHTDHLGTPRQLQDAQGPVVWQWPISAFGQVKPGSSGTSLLIQPSAAVLQLPSLFDFVLRYPGQQADSESGLFYNHHRYYDPNTGSYIQADPIGLNGGWNRFGYVGGNPLSFADPLGLMKLPNDPSSLPPGWAPDSSHRDPNGERFRDPNGDILDWHRGRPGLPGWRGKDHWHHNGGDEHLPPGTEVPDSCPPAPSLFDRLRNFLTPSPVYDPRRDRWMPVPPISPRVIPVPIP